MSDSADLASLSQFLQANVGILWSFVIPAAGAAIAWTIKTAIDAYRSFRFLDRQVQYEVSRDLLKARSESYEKLWTCLECLAIYSNKELSRYDLEQLGKTLSAWYFSPKGGIYLTSRTRALYFAFQDVVVLLSSYPDWSCTRRAQRPSVSFEDLQKRHLGSCQFSTNTATRIDHKKWFVFAREDLPGILKAEQRGEEIGELLFVVVQQYSSVLRTNLADELATRLDVVLPSR